MQSLMGETTAVAHGGNPQDRAAFPRPRCIALRQFLSTFARCADQLFPTTATKSNENFKLRLANW
ncbi:hypothetical protein [Moorena sp. SIO3H5]|uniref:hypothetical protein n=1 Tax=Moorena sp. SIO3H5 TaxID=2607834 RepID=UPI0013BDDFC5|nr:hypothetical protein [Moorena sp. SIO3H5]NEO73278.1 hypothetical protein [Moorena sp. SIO3H5]